ncbi:MAG: DUF3486 family protein [Rhodospirillaceae bacterium]|nr:DUF3486 family protein [Rhodospirillaceae bacterium]
MGRPSKIDRLPSELKELIGTLRKDGATIDEILAKLRELKPDLDVSRTGLGEHVQKIEEISAKIRESRTVAEALVSRFGDETDTRTSRLNIELMHSIVLKTVTSGDASALDPGEIMFLAKALQHLSSANKIDADMVARIKKEMAIAASKAVEKVAKAGGISKKTVEDIRAEILGLAT